MRRAIGVGGLVLALGAIGLITLSPAFSVQEKTFIWKLAHSPRAIFESVLNVLLFVPLGAALAILRLSLPRAALLGLLASTAIELLQLYVVPGRFAQLQDILANTLGAAAGALLLHLLAPRSAAR
jgi:glycopeptide antibiotics resistance protein